MSEHLTFQNVSVGYEKQVLIGGLYFGIKTGEIVCLIGPNGSGKSTILKSIASQLPPISGTILLSGKDLTACADRELSQRRAVMLTERVRTELLTCYEIVASGRYPYTGYFGRLNQEDEEKVEEALALLHATKLGPLDFSRLSDGQKQRVLFARALAQEPELLILDEPTSYLDVRYQLELLSILKRLSHERGLTIVMSLHELSLARRIADRLIGVREDHTVFQGKPEELFTPAFVRELYGIDPDMVDEGLLDYLMELSGKPGAV